MLPELQIANPLAAMAQGYETAQNIENAKKQKALNSAGMIAAATRGIQTPEDFDAAKQHLIQTNIVTEQEAQGYTFERMPELQNMVRTLEGQISDERDRRDYETGLSQWEQTFNQNKINADRNFELREANNDGLNTPKPTSPTGKITYDFQQGFITEDQKNTAIADLNTPADEYGRYKAEQEASGLPALGRIEYNQAKKGKGVSMTMPDGTVVQVGGGQGTGGGSPSSPQSMISTIDGILTDPALDWATGWLEWTQNIPSTGAKRFQGRAKQLSGQAFLQAFSSLKGGGQITEIEGTKATQAIGRLDTAQSPEDYRQALGELKDILSLAQSRPQGWAQTQGGTGATPQNPPPTFDFSGQSTEQLRQMLGQ